MKKSFLTICFVLLLVYGYAAEKQPILNQPAINLVTDGKSDFSIVISKAAPKCTLLAAQELQNYLSKTSVANLPVINQPAATGKNIFLGNNSALPAEARFDSRNYQNERYAILNWNGNLVIMGGEPEDDPATPGAANFGLLYGVYDFIENFLGVRWYAPGELGECVDKKASITISGLPIEYQPSFTYRSLWPTDSEIAPRTETLAWLRRLKVFGSKANALNHSLEAFSYEHRDTPEIFALDAHGKRIFGQCTVAMNGEKATYQWSEYPQFCLSAPRLADLLEQAINNWYAGGTEKRRGTFDRTPHDENYIYLGLPDNFGLNPCHCAECSKVLSMPNGFSNLVWSFVANIAARMKVDQPGKVISTLAYNRYVEAPDKQIVIPDNVSVKICVRPPIIYFGVPDYKNKSSRIIDEWSKRVKDISFWQYHNNFGETTIYPLDVPHIINDFYRRYQQNASAAFFQPGMIHSKEKSTTVIKNLPREMINLSFTMRSLWNPDYNADAELDKFYSLFFGPSAGEMKKYYGAILEKWEHLNEISLKGGNAVSGNISGTVIFKEIYPFETVKKLDKHIKAARNASPDGTIYRKRVDWFIKELHEPFYKLSEAYFKDNNNRELTVTESDTAPVIDGNIDDKAWQNVEKYDLLSASGPVTPACPTSFQATVKDNILYIAIKAADPHSAGQKKNATKRDGAVYMDDSVELFFVPDQKDPGKYCQIAINLNNVIYDARYDKKNKITDTKWQADLKTATKQMPGGWQMEIAVPLQDLGIKQFDCNAKIGFNLCRNKKSGLGEDHEASQWVPTSGSFHRTEAIGTLTKGNKPYFAESFDSPETKLQSCQYLHRFKEKTATGAFIAKEKYLPENIAYTIKDGKLIITADCVTAPDTADRIILALKNMTGIPVGDKTRMQVKIKSSVPGIQLLVGYSYEDTEGKTCKDYVKIQTADDWLVKSFDLRDDGQYAPKRAKENKRFGIPEIFNGMTIYITVKKLNGKASLIFEVEYINLI